MKTLTISYLNSLDEDTQIAMAEELGYDSYPELWDAVRTGAHNPDDVDPADDWDAEFYAANGEF